MVRDLRHRFWSSGSTALPQADCHSNQPHAAAAGAQENQQIQIKLADLIAPLLLAASQQKGWIHDFADDQITVPADLYEVIQAFNSL